MTIYNDRIAISNKQKTLIKRYFIDAVQILWNCNLIKNRYQIISDGKFKSINQLTLRNISERFLIHEKIHYQEIDT